MAKVAKYAPVSRGTGAYRRSMLRDRLLTVDDIADYLQVTPRFVEEQIRLDHIEAIVIGKDWRIRPSALTGYLDARSTMTPILRLVRD